MALASYCDVSLIIDQMLLVIYQNATIDMYMYYFLVMVAGVTWLLHTLSLAIWTNIMDHAVDNTGMYQ